MFHKTSTSLIAAALCLSLSATSAQAQFNVGRKFSSASKSVGSKISKSSKSFSKSSKSISKPNFRVPSPVKKIGTVKPKLPVTLPKTGIRLPKSPVTLPGRGIKPPSSIKFPKPGPITLPKPPNRFPKPGPIKNPLPIKLPKPGIKPIVPPNPIVKPLPKPGVGPIVPPNPGITPLPKPIKNPHPDGCWKPPHRCDWWTKICAPIRICRPVDVVRCHWNVVHCDTVIGGQVVDTRWYLGVEGVFLPGKGLGIESVAEGSPAAQVGLTAGMVIIQANGVALETEEAMQQVIASSQGILQVIVLSETSEQPLQGTIQMMRLASASF